MKAVVVVMFYCCLSVIDLVMLSLLTPDVTGSPWRVMLLHWAGTATSGILHTCVATLMNLLLPEHHSVQAVVEAFV